jgi:hypothetical protein
MNRILTGEEIIAGGLASPPPPLQLPRFRRLWFILTEQKYIFSLPQILHA